MIFDGGATGWTRPQPDCGAAGLSDALQQLLCDSMQTFFHFDRRLSFTLLATSFNSPWESSMSSQSQGYGLNDAQQ
jgi:hypothetical protein